MINELSHAFRRYDEQNNPLGLYAISEVRGLAQPAPQNWGDWNLIIKPTLDALTYHHSRAEHDLQEGQFTLHAPFRQSLRIRFVRLSKIKVRRYGSAYRIDPHFDFSARWEAADAPGQLCALAKMPCGERLLILLGFSQEKRPFFRELAEINDAVGAARIESAAHTQSVWPDPHHRNFQTLLAFWHWRN